jgi:hypothetical protein
VPKGNEAHWDRTGILAGKLGNARSGQPGMLLVGNRLVSVCSAGHTGDLLRLAEPMLLAMPKTGERTWKAKTPGSVRG